jgi:hypothetical protein
VRFGPAGSFIIEMPLDRGVLSVEWRFDAVSDRRTLIAQRIVLSDDHALEYATQVRNAFGSTLADGMKRIADAMARAERAETTGNHQSSRTAGLGCSCK